MFWIEEYVKLAVIQWEVIIWIYLRRIKKSAWNAPLFVKPVSKKVINVRHVILISISSRIIIVPWFLLLKSVAILLVLNALDRNFINVQLVQKIEIFTSLQQVILANADVSKIIKNLSTETIAFVKIKNYFLK